MLPTVSLLTIVKGRRQHLDNLIRGVAKMAVMPDELIVVHMNQPTAEDLPDPGCSLRQEVVMDDVDSLPLARARNHAARTASSELLVFLDVDCIPGSSYVGDMVTAVVDTKGLVMGTALYLPVDSGRDDWQEADLLRLAIPHPRRPEVPEGEVVSTDAYHLFWSLTFGLYRADFELIGGFDEGFHGYGGEDTDFAFTARRLGLPFYLADARCYHQHHDTCSPPYNHVENLVINANVFKEKWGTWPMEGWLESFREGGYVTWTDEELTITELPTQQVIDAHRSTDPFA